MKYPNIIFFRFKNYSAVDSKILNNNHYNCTFNITDNINDLNKLFNPNYHMLVTYGDDPTEYYPIILPNLIKRFCERWIHKLPSGLENIDEFNRTINYCYIYNVISKRELQRPIFSIFTTCYNTWEKFDRVYNSIKSQKLLDWEWVILEDTPIDKEKNHFDFLREKCKDDNRIRLYCRSENSGNIGNVKNEAVSLCRGQYLLELDHDDEILPDCLLDASQLFEQDKSIGFIYMDFANIYEDGKNFTYSDFICKGYGGYYCQKHNNKWVNVYITPDINNITLSALVCCPNHPRIWRRDTLLKLENYSEFLPICDDYEILLRTAINTKIAKIHKLGYIQYMNNDNNNFSLIRNSEINRLGPYYISPQFYEMYNVHDIMKTFDAYESEDFVYNHSQIWKRENYEHKYCNKIINQDYDKQYCLIGIESLDRTDIQELYQNPRYDFIILSNKHYTKELIEKIESKGFYRLKCYSLLDATDKELENYFNLLCKHNNNYEILYPDNINNFEERQIIINNYIYKENKKSYLEIGVEYGTTFNKIICDKKIGVDPDPKIEDERIIKKTSDNYFTEKGDEKFDIIFIDGMHQTDYVYRDFNNSIDNLTENGAIFLDDILPENEKEQLKIPENPIYENGILKYSSPWTGDVWKIVYYILLHQKENIKYEIYTHPNYRGVMKLEFINKFYIDPETIDIINNYNYKDDFTRYKNLLKL